MDVHEGQAASGAIAATTQAVTLRAGQSQTIDVLANPAPSGSNPNPEMIAITGSSDSDVINLGGGADTVNLGSASESVNGGTGTDTINATASTAGALILGGTGTTTLNVTGGGTVSLNAGDAGVKASATAYSFTSNAQSGLLISDQSATDDTISAGGPGQTITGGAAGKLTVVAATGGGTTFKDTSALMNGDAISNFAPTANAGNVIDLTDMNASKASATLTENATGSQAQLKRSPTEPTRLR